MLPGLLFCANLDLLPVRTDEGVGALLAKGCGDLIPVTLDLIPKPCRDSAALNHVHKLT